MTTPPGAPASPPFDRLRTAFHALIAVELPARGDELRRIEADDPAIGAQLRALLSHFDETDLLAAPEKAPPSRVGPYRLLHRLGRGGMGEVFLAERVEEGLAQRVALKFVRHAALSPDMERRLRRERGLLAQLSHPRVAGLIDAGSSESHGPWFAMEFVEGQWITRYADAKRLNVSARLALWLQVAEAVAHAHRHAIVHRDLKPANVLVDADGNAKLLDFGIAKFIDATADPASTAAAFTARYASPEQITGAPVTTATDVHGLGLLLYELLAGQPPFREPNDFDLRQSIAHTDPPSMLACLGQAGEAQATALAAARQASLPELRRELGGDLAAVVAMALRKLPEDRYGSASEFAADVSRFLAGEPVSAVPPTAAYRLRRFVGRHRIATLLVATAAVTMCVALAIALVQRAQSLSARQQAEAESALLVGIIAGGDPYHLKGSELRVSDMLDTAANDTLKRTDLHPRLRAHLLDTIATALIGLSRNDAANAALAGARESLAQAPDAPSALRDGIELRYALTQFELGERESARAALEALWVRFPSFPTPLQIEALEWRAHLRRADGDIAGALADIDAALALCGSGCGEGVDARSSLVIKRIDLLARSTRHDEAIAYADEAWAQVQSLPPARAAIRLAIGGSRAAALAFAGRNALAEEALQELLPMADAFYGGRGNRLAALYASLGQIQRNRSQYRDAAQSAARVVDLYSDTLPDSVYLAYALKIHGLDLRLISEHEKALPLLHRCRDMFRQVEGDASAESAWCGINAAAAQWGKSLAAADLATLLEAGEALLASSATQHRWVTAMLLVEAAVDAGDLLQAGRMAAVARAETAAHASRGPAHDARLRALEWQLQLLEGQPVADQVEAFATQLAAQEGGALSHARLRSALARAQPSAATCAAAKAAWDRIDVQQVAWNEERRRLPGCR